MTDYGWRFNYEIIPARTGGYGLTVWVDGTESPTGSKVVVVSTHCDTRWGARWEAKRKARSYLRARKRRASRGAIFLGGKRD